MKKIKIFKASSFKYTPFDNFGEGDYDFLFSNGVEFVDNVKLADIIISQNIKKLKKYFWLRKKFLIWTNEPRFNTTFSSVKKYCLGLLKIHFMNIYTQDVFCSNLSFHAKGIDDKLNLLNKPFQLNNRKVVALMSYYKGVKSEPLIRNNVNIDLIALRSKICLYGVENKLMDVFGKGWPVGVSKEDSRDGDWPTRKKELLSNYHFNLCFENTISPNYMTEKIWHSIANYCLPIYYGKGTNVYDLFPKNSFIDFSEFKSIPNLFDFILNISNDEFIERMNKCIKVYNSISENNIEIYQKERAKVLENIINKLTLIANE